MNSHVFKSRLPFLVTVCKVHCDMSQACINITVSDQNKLTLWLTEIFHKEKKMNRALFSLPPKCK